MSAEAPSRLPGPLRPLPALPFVGRSQELALLDRLRLDAEREGPRVALIRGDPGCGKTRLARELAERAVNAGSAVLYGACAPSLPAPYGAFVEALEHLAEEGSSALLEMARGPRREELARLLPDLAGRAPASAPTIGADPGGARHRLHGAVAELLAAHARTQPVVLVLDDLHWADAPTLLLLQHLARAGAGMRVLVLAAFRDVDVDVAPDLAEAIGELQRLDGVTRVPLTGLRPPEIEEFLRRLAPAAGADLRRRAHELADLTGGNAFLVGELGRHLAEAGLLADGRELARALDDIGVPQGVHDVAGQRRARLGPAARDLLELAAIGGRGIELVVLRSAAALDEAPLVAALEEALRSDMLEEVPGPRIAYRFRHELLRLAVLDRLPFTRRAALHLRVGTALETVHGPDQDRTVNDLAFHFGAAVDLGGPDRAVRYALRAAGAAMRSLAYEDAAARLEGALELGIADPGTRARALHDLGTALHRAARAPQALESYAAAAELARSNGDVALLAAAAIGFENACWRPGIGDGRSVALLAEAAELVSGDETALRVRLLAGLSRALAYRGDHDAAAQRWHEAVGMARRIGDRRSLAVTLFHAAWTRGSRSPAAVLASLTEALRLAEQLGDDELAHEIQGFRLSLLLESYELPALRRELPAFRAAVERSGQPFYMHVFLYMCVTLAIWDGRFDEAETLATQALELSRRFDEDASAIHGIQMFSVRREQGRLAEVAPVIRLLAAGGEARAAWGPALAVLMAELGMVEQARREIARLCADDLALVARGGLWLGGLAYLADACAIAEDAAHAAVLYDELLELSGRNLVIGQAVACYGAADRFLGLLATTMGEHAAAERHFEAALERNGRSGSPVWLAHTRYGYARALLRRGDDGDHARAAELLGDALRSARALGMAALVERCELLGLPLRPSALPDGLSAREVEVLRLLSNGLSNREIGDALTISQHTAANHVRSILLKTGCSNRTDAASYAHRNRLIER